MTRRVVLDTNVVVSALLFESGRLSWLRRAWMAGDYRLLVSRATVAEVLRVLAYPKFQLAGEEIEILLGDFLPYAEPVEVPEAGKAWAGLPHPDDRIFLDLAAAGHAEFLVTGDRGFRSVRPPPGCRIVTPAEFAPLGQTRVPSSGSTRTCAKTAGSLRGAKTPSN